MQCGYWMMVFFFRCLFYYIAVSYCFLAIAPAALPIQRKGIYFGLSKKKQNSWGKKKSGAARCE